MEILWSHPDCPLQQGWPEPVGLPQHRRILCPLCHHLSHGFPWERHQSDFQEGLWAELREHSWSITSEGFSEHSCGSGGSQNSLPAGPAPRAVLVRGHRGPQPHSPGCPSMRQEPSGVWRCYRNTNTRLALRRTLPKALETSEPTPYHPFAFDPSQTAVFTMRWKEMWKDALNETSPRFPALHGLLCLFLGCFAELSQIHRPVLALLLHGFPDSNPSYPTRGRRKSCCHYQERENKIS